MKLLDLLFDRRCAVCDDPIKSGAVCSHCDEILVSAAVRRIRVIESDDMYAEALYLFDYENETARKLLFALKRFSNKELMKYAASLYERVVPEDFCGIVVNCPRGKSAIREYGFDQVAEPCKIMCKNSGGRLKYENALKRRGFSRQQKKLSLAGRKNNTYGKFMAVKKDIRENILLTDDVVTTGNTAFECVRELKKSNPGANITLAFLASR